MRSGAFKNLADPLQCDRRNQTSLLNARGAQHNLTESPKSHQHTCNFPRFTCFPGRQANRNLQVTGYFARKNMKLLGMTFHSHVAKSWSYVHTLRPISDIVLLFETAPIILQIRLICEHLFTISINLVYLRTQDLQFCQQTQVQLLFLELLRLISKDLTFSRCQELAHMKLAHAHCTQYPIQWPKPAFATTDSDLHTAILQPLTACNFGQLGSFAHLWRPYCQRKQLRRLHSLELWVLVT